MLSEIGLFNLNFFTILFCMWKEWFLSFHHVGPRNRQTSLPAEPSGWPMLDFPLNNTSSDPPMPIDIILPLILKCCEIVHLFYGFTDIYLTNPIDEHLKNLGKVVTIPADGIWWIITHSVLVWNFNACWLLLSEHLGKFKYFLSNILAA